MRMGGALAPPLCFLLLLNKKTFYKMGHFDKLHANKIEANTIAHEAMLATKGTDIADSTAALAMDSTYINKVAFSLLDGAGKTVTLPEFETPGDKVVIVLAASLVASGVLTIDCAGTQSFDTGSYYAYEGASNVDKIDQATSGETKLVATGSATNSGAAIGSRIEFLYVGGGKILVSGRGEALGTGSDAWAFAA
tara:strand:- start:756 stop:1337 length:582 start_codon:yes stop_codon:yes gene_type:complete